MAGSTTYDRQGAISARDGAAEALAAMLLTDCVARIDGGSVADQPRALKNAYSDWPSGRVPLDTPSVTIVDISLTDDDYDLDLDVPMSVDGLSTLAITESCGEFAVDLWATDKVERKAFKAAISASFRNPSAKDGAIHPSGRVRIVPVPVDAIPHAFVGRADFSPVIRLTLTSLPQNVDDETSAEQDKWRAHAVVAWEAQVMTEADIARLDAVAFIGPLVNDMIAKDALGELVADDGDSDD